MNGASDKRGSSGVNPWDRNARLSDERGAASGAPPAPGRHPEWNDPAATQPAASLPHCGEPLPQRKQPPRAVWLSAWAGVMGMVCGIFATVGPWLFSGADLSVAVWVTAALAIALGGYAALGVYHGVGRADIAMAGIILGGVAIIAELARRPGPLFAPNT